MRRLGLLLCLALAVGTVDAWGGRAPALVLVDSHPLTLRGSAFAPSDRVQVRVRADSRARTRIVRAGRTGAFTVVFPRFRVRDLCTLESTAAGSTGPVAKVRLPRRLCPVPLPPPAP